MPDTRPGMTAIRRKTAAPCGAAVVTRRQGSSIPHLLLHLLVDPDAGVDRPWPHRAGAQFAAVVLHPRPPGRVGVRRRQPEIRRLVDDLAGHFADHRLALV